jgi:hypothetical protein
MASSQLQLQPPRTEPRAFEFWLQHAAGRILFEDVRAYALENIDPGLSAESRSAAEKGVNDALYGLLMVIDGVSGTLANESQHVELSVQVQLVNDESDGDVIALDLREGDGMCMGYHRWIEGNFGANPVALPRP